ncbi:MAG: T9SS type A sorting domain-containing protein [Chitinophagales bacterium]|nr:T9SS type A sorting domain-containing protein [Chitinophagales bacterium]
MINKYIIILVFNLLGSLLTAQQITYTSVPNIKDTFDYSEHSFIFHNQTYLQRSRLPEYIFFSKLDNLGNPVKNYAFTPKLGYIRFAFYTTQIGSKLFQFGAEEDTIDRRGSVFILNSDFSIFKDSVFFDYPNMEFNVARYDQKRNKVIATFAYSIHKDSFLVRRWGIIELDTLGNLLRIKEIPPLFRFEYADNLLVTSDGGYLVSGKMNGRTTNIDPFFIKLDTNFNVIWRNDLTSTGEKFFTQDFSENLVELSNGKGYVYVGSMHRNIDTVTRKCRYFDHFTSLHFISLSGQITKNYYHNLNNQNCETSRPKGLFLKNDSTLMIFTQRDTTSDGIITGKDSGSSLVIHYNFNQHKVTKEIIGGQLLNDKTSWILPGYNGICYRRDVKRDVDGGFITSGWANINDNRGTSAYLMKTDSCGYTQDHKCKIVYKIDTQYGNTLKVRIIDSLSVLCQPIWTIEGKQYTSLEITHNFSTTGIHTIKLWGFAGSTVDSLSFQVRVDSMNSGIKVLKEKEIKIFPNPVKSYLIVEGNRVLEGNVKLSDLLGQQMSPKVELTSSGYRIDIKHLPNGIYFIHLTDKSENTIFSKKIVIEHE